MRFLLVWCLLLAAIAPVAADTMRGVVIVVIDGDTVLFKPEHYASASRAFLKIRLADIDAPESDQPYGDVATGALTALLLDRQVEVDTVATDVYGRTIAHMQLDALAVNEALVRQGLAWASGRRGHATLKEAQREARQAQRGLWQDAAPTPPWVWRRTHATSANEVLSR